MLLQPVYPTDLTAEQFFQLLAESSEHVRQELGDRVTVVRTVALRAPGQRGEGVLQGLCHAPRQFQADLSDARALGLDLLVREISQYVLQFPDERVLQVCRVRRRPLGGAGQPGEVVFADTAGEEAVERNRNVLDVLVEDRDEEALDGRGQHREADRDRGNQEGVADMSHEPGQARLDRLRTRCGVELLKPTDQPGERSKDAQAGEYSRHVLEELGPNPGVDDGVCREYAGGGNRRAKDLGSLLGVARFLLAMKRLGIFRPQMRKGLVSGKHFLQRSGIRSFLRVEPAADLSESEEHHARPSDENHEEERRENQDAERDDFRHQRGADEDVQHFRHQSLSRSVLTLAFGLRLPLRFSQARVASSTIS